MARTRMSCTALRFPYKFKIQVLGAAPTIASLPLLGPIMSVIGTWKRRHSQVDQKEVAKPMLTGGLNIHARRLRQLPHQVHGLGRQEN
jgi:hypothetical protein